MKQLIAALVTAAFSAAVFAQGTAPAAPAANTVTKPSAAPAKTEVKKTKKKKAKKTPGASAAPADQPKK